MAVITCTSPISLCRPRRSLPPRSGLCVCHLSATGKLSYFCCHFIGHLVRSGVTSFVCGTELKPWRAIASTALAAAVVSFGGLGAVPAMAELNKFEAEMRGEFGIGSAAQFGSADLKKAVHANENFRRANFTAADMRESNFSGCTFNGAYLEKAVAYKANFSGADLSDTLMDRMVLNEANLTNAVLVRSVLTRSDLGGAIIEGVSTRKSLGCGNNRRSAYGTPSSPLLSAPPQRLLDSDGYCDESTGLCEANK
ncbi:Thylakoid lumenal protein [Apostasia shenzhenica]|uniref:Thylakoid lumenal protein n=1 Tax=Apostasia shenzhenica TaxID=1088818 RepID=A0A2H9ZYU6_9ASPA|nr:Thylakoid lumenal protein [Apostasia shenzhenica]